MSAGVVEIGTKARSVTGREKYRGKVSNVPAKVEKEETRAEESVIETDIKMVSLKYYIECKSFNKTCYRLSRYVPSPC
jgi:hypothetical protein